MVNNARSIRPFIGAKDFDESRKFYRELGFEETVVSNVLSVFKTQDLAFYLQNAYVPDWVDNTMLFLEVNDLDTYYQHLVSLGLSQKFSGARLHPIRDEQWGRECFLHDPSGILWHIGTFNSSEQI